MNAFSVANLTFLNGDRERDRVDFCDKFSSDFLQWVHIELIKNSVTLRVKRPVFL